jgi:hypothetical protein
VKLVFLLLPILLIGCASGTRKGCEDQVRKLYEKADASEHLFVISTQEAGSDRGARALLRDKVPAFHRGGQSISIKRSRNHNSSNEYYEKNDSGFWTLNDGSRQEPDLICQKVNGYFYAYAIVDVRKIKSYLLN